jgi:hypothetical protein
LRSSLIRNVFRRRRCEALRKSTFIPSLILSPPCLSIVGTYLATHQRGIRKLPCSKSIARLQSCYYALCSLHCSSHCCSSKSHRTCRTHATDIVAEMFLPSVYVPNYGLPTARTAQGKVAELRLELNSGGKKDKNNAAKKIALKKIVANMTMSNNDMVALFPDIVACMQIPSLEIKKMLVSSARIQSRLQG